MCEHNHGRLPLEFFVAGDELQLFSRKLRGFRTDSPSIQIGHVKISSSPTSNNVLSALLKYHAMTIVLPFLIVINPQNVGDHEKSGATHCKVFPEMLGITKKDPLC